MSKIQSISPPPAASITAEPLPPAQSAKVYDDATFRQRVEAGENPNAVEIDFAAHNVSTQFGEHSPTTDESARLKKETLHADRYVDLPGPAGHKAEHLGHGHKHRNRRGRGGKHAIGHGHARHRLKVEQSKHPHPPQHATRVAAAHTSAAPPATGEAPIAVPRSAAPPAPPGVTTRTPPPAPVKKPASSSPPPKKFPMQRGLTQPQ